MTIRAIHRDLHRLVRALPTGMDDRRRYALVGHVDFLSGRAAELQRALRDTILPQLRPRRPDLQARGERALAAHAEIATGFRTAVHSAHWWGGDPARWAPLTADLERVEAMFGSGAVIDDDLLAELSSSASAEEWLRLRRSAYDRLSTSRLAHLTSWQLDELDPVLGLPLTDGIRPSALWLLRAGIDDGYERQAELMWTGRRPLIRVGRRPLIRVDGSRTAAR